VSVLQAAVLVLAAAAATATALTRDPLRQAMLSSVYGLVLGLLFFVFQAPDVAQTTVGAVALPLMILLALAKVRGGSE
jgi:energy-converting hydrogenase B subunit D